MAGRRDGRRGQENGGLKPTLRGLLRWAGNSVISVLWPFAGVRNFWPVDSPIERVHAKCYGFVETGIWPGGGMGGEAMFDRVEMDVVHMCRIIAVIADCVLPIAALP